VSELTPDLIRIGTDLSRAIHQDHQQAQRRRSQARIAALAGAAICAVSGAGVAGAALTGLIDLGGGHSAAPVNSTPAPNDTNLPYEYQVSGVHNHDGQSGTIYIESSQPLDNLTRQQLVAARNACASKTMRVGSAVVWIFDTTCTPATP
jgi:hypothetical protein